MGVVRRGQPGPDIQELPDTRLCDQEVHRPGQERPLRPDREHHIRVRGGDLLGDRPVSREVVLAAQPEVVNPRHMSPACVERDIPARRLLAARHLTLSRRIPVAGNASLPRAPAQPGEAAQARSPPISDRASAGPTTRS